MTKSIFVALAALAVAVPCSGQQRQVSGYANYVNPMHSSQTSWGGGAQYQLLCQGEDIPCPPTEIPRQQALFMAMALNVPLIKVSEDDASSTGRIEPTSLIAERLRD